MIVTDGKRERKQVGVRASERKINRYREDERGRSKEREAALIAWALGVPGRLKLRGDIKIDFFSPAQLPRITCTLGDKSQSRHNLGAAG